MARRLSRILLWIVIALLALALILAAFGLYTVRRSFPQVEGTLQLPGLQAPVHVYRDGLGVPHIYAENEHDLFMAQGFIHAQDRFWQMDFWRHIGSGRLAEMFGESQVETDAFIRALGWPRIAEQEYALADEDTKAILEAYAEGVNAYLATRSGASLSLEYAVLGLLNRGYRPEPWTPVHTLTWAKAMAWDLGGNMDAEVLRARMLRAFGPDRAADLFPPYPEESPVIVPGAPTLERADAPSPEAALALLPDLTPLARRAAALDALLGGRFSGLGSNNWVVAGDRTATGMPLLANDPHLAIQMPAIWYENGLHCRPVGPDCRFNVVGFSFAGAPGVIIGHNDRIAWGVTNVGPDVQDLYIEKINPEDPNQYEVNGQWVDMEVRQETIQVAGGDPVTVTVRLTRHGPILSDFDEDLAALDQTTDLDLPATYAVSLRWTALEPDLILQSVLRLNIARNWEEFRDALRFWGAPSQNFVYADVEGNIGYQMPGKVPIRASGNGLLPVPGWTDDYEWVSFIPFDDLPYTFNPDQGYVVTANNAVVGPEYPHLISLGWDYGYRARRIVERIETASRPLTVEDMRDIQGDNYNAMGPVLVPLVTSLAYEDARLRAMADLLAGWDFRNDADSAEAALFNAFWHHLILATFGDEFQPPEGGETDVAAQILGADDIPSDDRAFLVIERLVEDPQSPWWDDVTTPEMEDRDAILRRALAAAVEELDARLGTDPADWSWGALHTATFENQTLGRSGIAPIEALFNRGPFPTGGGASIVNATGWDFKDGYEVRWLPSMRMIIDLSDFDRSRAIHTTGQSGHAFHPHYIDMAPLWARVEDAPLLWSEAAVQAAAEAHLVLEP